MTAVIPAGPVAPGVQRQGGGGTALRGAEKISVDRGQGVARARIARVYAGRVLLRQLLKGWGLADHRTARCGFRLGSAAEGETWVRRNGRTDHVGRETCGSGKLCAVCHDAAAIVRAAVVAVVVWRWLADDEHSALFVSMAPGHKAGDRLDLAHDRLMEARAAMMDSQRRSWRRFRQNFGVKDILWVAEHTVGDNGPHCQIHAVLLLDRHLEAEDADRCEANLWSLLRRELVRLGHEHRFGARAIDLRPVVDGPGLSAYVAKLGLGAEVTGLGGKEGRSDRSISYLMIPARLAELRGHRDPLQVAEQDSEVRRLVDALHEYAELVTSDHERGRKWWKNFSSVRKVVPELTEFEAQGLRGAALAAALLGLLPAEVRPQINNGRTETPDSDDDQEGDVEREPTRPAVEVLHVDADSWQAAQEAWWGARCSPERWWGLLRGLMPGVQARGRIDLSLVVTWLLDDLGAEAAADAIAVLSGGEVTEEDVGWSVRWASLGRTVYGK